MQPQFVANAAASLANLFVGTTGPGHVFAGANIPFGLAKPVADTNNRTSNLGGFTTDDSLITGFSHTHDSGTGGSRSLGNFPFFAGICDAAEGSRGSFEGCTYGYLDRPVARTSVNATPGHFNIALANGIIVDMTATRRVASYELSLPVAPGHQPYMVFELRDLNVDEIPGSIEVDTSSERSTRVTGQGTFGPSFGHGDYKSYFCAKLDAPAQAVRIFERDQIREAFRVECPAKRERMDSGSMPMGYGVILKFNQDLLRVRVRVGMSFVSVDQACATITEEAPDSITHRELRIEASSKWQKALSAVDVDVTDADPDAASLLYTSIYRSMISPQNYTGENPLWSSSAPYYDSYYCIWDSVHTTDPLLNIINPRAHVEMMQSMLDIYEHEGFLPDCRMSLCKGFTQGGSNADTVLGDAYMKGIRGVDWSLALQAVRKDGEVNPPDFTVEGRGNIDGYLSLGYVALDDRGKNRGTYTRSVSRTLEYAANDFSIALMASSLGSDQEVLGRYVRTSGSWKNVWDPNLQHDGFRGFVMPRNKRGDFQAIDPTRCSPANPAGGCFLGDGGGEFYETSPWSYSFTAAPHDMESLIQLMGGPETFIKRLDHMFDNNYHDIGNEPGFPAIFAYHYAGAPHRSTLRVRALLAEYYGLRSDDLPGNDDSGAQGSLVAWSSMGMFPMAGQDVYLLVTPHFREVRFRQGDGDDPSKPPAVIRCHGFSRRNAYIQRASLNGRPYHKSWIQHSFFLTGSVLELWLGPVPSETWGRVIPNEPVQGPAAIEDLPAADPTKYRDAPGTLPKKPMGRTYRKPGGFVKRAETGNESDEEASYDVRVVPPSAGAGVAAGFLAYHVATHDPADAAMYELASSAAVASLRERPTAYDTWDIDLSSAKNWATTRFYSTNAADLGRPNGVLAKLLFICIAVLLLITTMPESWAHRLAGRSRTGESLWLLRHWLRRRLRLDRKRPSSSSSQGDESLLPLTNVRVSATQDHDLEEGSLGVSKKTAID
ncbi:hypothetical protein PYCC9005_005876 [Savitreella phatthalungensis]